MNVQTITVNLRASRPGKDGAWKTVEVGAQASLEPWETWQQSQAALYGELADQLKSLWNGERRAA